MAKIDYPGKNNTINTVNLPASLDLSIQKKIDAIPRYMTEELELNSNNILEKKITLTHTPIEPTRVELMIVGAGTQDYEIDYVVVAKDLSWSGLTLDGILNAEDVIRVNYTYLVGN